MGRPIWSISSKIPHQPGEHARSTNLSPLSSKRTVATKCSTFETNLPIWTNYLSAIHRPQGTEIVLNLRDRHRKKYLLLRCKLCARASSRLRMSVISCGSWMRKNVAVIANIPANSMLSRMSAVLVISDIQDRSLVRPSGPSPKTSGKIFCWKTSSISAFLLVIVRTTTGRHFVESRTKGGLFPSVQLLRNIEGADCDTL